mmetsp:Transcript_33681/g.80237  ORF Transcript_33681/g.80237 Transcript_33681/m.80237 type:complete len:138 (+) Transcript_33681:50-463(+)
MGDVNAYHLWWQERIFKERHASRGPKSCPVTPRSTTPQLGPSRPLYRSKELPFSSLVVPSTNIVDTSSTKFFTPRSARSLTPGPQPLVLDGRSSRLQASTTLRDVETRSHSVQKGNRSYLDLNEVVNHRFTNSLRRR